MNALSVFRDEHSHCCLRVSEQDEKVSYIALVEEAGSISVEMFTVGARDFYGEYTHELTTYPVQRAAKHYLNPLTAAITVSAKARKVLEAIVHNRKGIDMTEVTEVKAPKTIVKKAPKKEVAAVEETAPAEAAKKAAMNKAERNVEATKKASVKKTGSEPKVAEVTKDTGPKTKAKKGTFDQKVNPTEENNAAQIRAIKNKDKTAMKTASKKTAAKKTTAKKAAPAAKKVTKKSAPAAKKAAPAKKTGGTRISYAGKKIKALVKSAEEAGLRAGTVRAAMLNTVLKSKNTDEVLGKEINVGGDRVAIGGSNIAFMVAQGWVQLS